jgi:hypothetical protein
MSTAPLPTERQQLRTTLATLAARTKAKLPALNGRVEKACTLVLAGDVELHEDGTALVHSLSDPSRAYQITQGVCQCRDWGQAPEHLCCHRLAAGFLRKAEELLAAPDPAPASDGVGSSDTTPRPEGVCSTYPLPEAPVSITLKASFDGQEVLVTLRGHDFASVQAQVEQASAWLKAHAPTPSPLGPQGQGQGKDWCSIHNVPMKQTTKDGRSWYSHRVDGRWCKGR